MTKVLYALRETVTNLSRNLTLALATVLCVGISLALLGSAWVIRLGVENATQRFEEDVEFIIFINPDASEAQIDSVETALNESPLVQSVDFYDKQEAYEEFRRMFAESEDLVDTVTAEELPPSFRVKPEELDPIAIRELGDSFTAQPGVLRVSFADEVAERIKGLSDKVSLLMFAAAGTLLVAALFLILNTIIVAIRSRRRDIEVMKLVGASNLFVQVPFMLEGVLQCLAGAAIAVGATWALSKALVSEFASDELPLLAGFYVDNGEIFNTSIVLLLVGILIGVIGSLIAVTRYLDV